MSTRTAWQSRRSVRRTPAGRGPCARTVSTTQDTRRAAAYGSCAMTYSTSRSKGSIPVVRSRARGSAPAARPKRRGRRALPPLALVPDPDRPAGSGGVPGWIRALAWMLVFSSAQTTCSSAQRLGRRSDRRARSRIARRGRPRAEPHAAVPARVPAEGRPPHPQPDHSIRRSPWISGSPMSRCGSPVIQAASTVATAGASTGDAYDQRALAESFFASLEPS